MQLTFLILVLFCYIEQSIPIPPPYSDSAWRPSRYIIDNRRNALFSKKSPAILQLSQHDSPRQSTNFKPDPFKSRLLPVERYQKDLTAEASIAESKFYRKYDENVLPRKIVKSLIINENFGKPDELKFSLEESEDQKNSSEGFDSQNFLQNDVYNEVTSKIAATTEKVQSWAPETDQHELISETPSAATTSKMSQITSQSTAALNFESSTMESFPWEIENPKAEEGNQIDTSNEKHVYETRIETVSYHQEVILNPPKKQNWFQGQRKQKPESYETPEKNYEEQEKSFEASEENYEESEKNYELDEVMPGDGIHPAENEENQNKFGYVVEGANYRKYRVEERTVDGFIVGEYGVVSHDDGSLRGVRYTADSNINPQLIYETLIKFLSL